MTDEIKDRLVRIETRLVKYQENNVQQLMGLHDAIDRLCDALDNLLTDQPEEGNDHDNG